MPSFVFDPPTAIPPAQNGLAHLGWPQGLEPCGLAGPGPLFIRPRAVGPSVSSGRAGMGTVVVPTSGRAVTVVARLWRNPGHPAQPSPGSHFPGGGPADRGCDLGLTFSSPRSDYPPKP